MEHSTMSLLREWANFYVIMGSSAAVLIGLQFVVITLGAQIHVLGSDSTINTFGTPTVIHFCVVLLVSGIVSAPWSDFRAVGAALSVCGTAGLAYAVLIVWRERRQTGYKPVLEDWIFHAILPLCAYTALLAAGILMSHVPALALFAVGGAMLLLVFIGIHNAWDTVVYMTVSQRPEEQEEQ